MATRKRSQPARSSSAATTHDEAPVDGETPVVERRRAVPRKGPVWMVPTADGGMVPEHELRRKG